MLDNQLIQKSRENSEGPISPEHGRIYLNAETAIVEFESENFVSIQTTKIEDKRISQYLQNARTLIRHGEFPLALNLLRQASNLDSMNPTTLEMLGSCLEQVNKFEEALYARKALAKAQPNFENLHKLATCYYKLGRDADALEQYYEALVHLTEENIFLFETYKNMGNIFVRQGDFDGAEEYYNKAYTLNAASDVLLVNLGTLQVQRNDFDKSLYCFRKAVEINRQNDKAWVGLAMVHNQLGDMELAWANLDSALDINPQNRTAAHLCANWAVRDEMPTRAVKILEDYVSAADQDEDMSLVLINLHCMTNAFQKARLEIERVLSWNPANLEVQNLKKTLDQQKKAA